MVISVFSRQIGFIMCHKSVPAFSVHQGILFFNLSGRADALAEFCRNLTFFDAARPIFKKLAQTGVPNLGTPVSIDSWNCVRREKQGKQDYRNSIPEREQNRFTIPLLHVIEHQ